MAQIPQSWDCKGAFGTVASTLIAEWVPDRPSHPLPDQCQSLGSEPLAGCYLEVKVGCLGPAPGVL